MADLIGLTLERREKLKESRSTLSDKTRTADSAKPYVWIAHAKLTDCSIYKTSQNT